MNKEKNDNFVSVPVGKIISETNRKHGGMGNIEILAESIKTDGLINPPTVTESGDGKYRIVAGRRRIEAIRQLKWKDVTVRVISEADAVRLESIGLSENVNRQEMHPLDEAETFKKLLDKGSDIKDIAAYYDRSVAGIHHRIKLCDLRDEIKEMFRSGKIDLSGAALIASLPNEDQEKFFKKFGNKGATKWEILPFIHSVQHFTLQGIADKKCEKCQKRTRNTTPGLFEDYISLKDVCFDSECYTKKWQETILHFIVESGDEGNTEHNIILDRDIPQFVPKKTAVIDLEGDDYTLLAYSTHTWSKTKKKAKKNTAWLVSMDDGGITVSRVAYEKYDRSAYYGSYVPPDPVQEYMIDLVPEIEPEKRKAAADKVKAKYSWPGRLRNEIKEAILDEIIEKRLREESRENLAALYMRDKFHGEDPEGNFVEFDTDYEELFVATLGTLGIAKISEIPMEPLIEKFLLFIITARIRTDDMPDITDNENEWGENENSLFWKYAQIGKEEYLQRYKALLAEKIKSITEKPALPKPEETGEDENLDEDSGEDTEDPPEDE
jgi:ParB/RepB/Spo0J family partition protein